MNFESGDYLSAYVDISVQTMAKYEKKGGNKNGEYRANKNLAYNNLKALDGVFAVQDQKNIDYAASAT